MSPDDDSPDRGRTPADRAGATPAERAGATPLDPARFRANAGRLPADRRLAEEAPGVAPAYEVRRRRRRRERSSRAWFVAAALLVVVGLALGAAGWFGRDEVEVATSAAPDLVLATPLASARRVPEVVVRPVAARNLRAAVDPLLATAPAGTCLEARDSGSQVLGHQQTTPLVPASNMKLLTGAAVLDVLGPETRLSTRIATDGAPSDGTTVRGNLYLVGGGDPLLITEGYAALAAHGRTPETDMEGLADQIVNSGVRRITGSVVGDASRYDDVRTAPSWPERFLTQGQSGPLSALMVNDGWKLTGGPVDDPTLHAATVLGDLLRERGVQIDGAPAVGAAPAGATTLLEVQSLPVAELVDQALRFSDNTTTELLVKELGVAAGGGGTTAAGVQVMRDWVASSGLPAEGLSFDDGSGLSANDRLTCTFLGALLSQDGPAGVLAAGLAVPGEPGTLDDRFLSEPLRSRLTAKTGTLNAVTGLSGWLATVPGSELAFSMLINSDGRNISEADFTMQRRVLEALTTYPQAPPLDSLGPAAPVAPAP